MYSLLIFLHIVICIFLTVVILLQSSKGGGLAGTFGGSAMGAVFGGRGTAPFLKKVTTIVASLFLVLSLLLSLMTRGSMTQESVVQRNIERFQNTSPARGLPQQRPVESATQPPATPPPAQSGSQSGEN